ncbi:alanine racemase [Synechococcus sp. PCC 7502]|uniref:alanine racemase n=1 Tax=Synechococcus sp. PCC 7502 TaxID=1173263 RepID=UPI00029FA00F|nr:alanine racemase [Synechococcus sp. PCC 7502]AFY72925.1 alanine racemase [Synechococcus sp. PCC 7502]
MLKQNYRAWVEIDLSAIRHNIRTLKSLLSDSKELMAVVKADAYGHGAIAVSQAVLEAGATWLGVATIVEGVQLRNAGITAPILILGATNSPDEIKAIAENRLQPTICTIDQALSFNQILNEAWEEHSVSTVINSPVLVHLKIDTGMSRLGTSWQEAKDFIKLVHSLPYLKIHSIYSHLATADESDQTILRLQHQRFKQVISLLKEFNIQPHLIHIANTAGMMTNSDLHYDLVRCGLGVYGFYPAPHLKIHLKTQLKESLRPAMQVKARVTQVKNIAAGTGVSYGYSFIAPKDMRIATVAIGYADGVPRGLSNQLFVTVGDRSEPVAQVGTITMDQCLIDVTDVPEVKIGDVVTILGNSEDNNADRWAEILGTISWEILCGFKHRLPRLMRR